MGSSHDDPETTVPHPHDRYALRDDRAPDADLRRNGFEAEVTAQWFTAEVDRKLMKSLMKRSDGPALRHFGLWLALLAASGTAGVLTWGTWWALPCFLLYGTFYSMSDHHAHELSHGTPFRTRWLNEALYHLNAFMALHEANYWRWSHTRHHTHTMLVGKDPEIAVPRPANRLHVLMDFFFLRSGATQLSHILRNATGRLEPAAQHVVPAAERGHVVALSRIYVAIFAAVIVACVASGSVLPALLVVLPRFYGGVVAQVFNIPQHAGLAEDVHDHRVNTRTFLAGPVGRWLYCNMNYHIEHHMFPMVPFHRLPELHAAIASQCPAPHPSVWAAWREILPALAQQSRDAGHTIGRPLPATAK